MHNFLLALALACVLLNTGCGLIQQLGNKNAQASPTPEPTATPKPDYSRPFNKVADTLTQIPAKVIPGDGYIKGPPVRFYQSISLDDKEKKTKKMWTHDDTQVGKTDRAQTPEEAQTVILQKCDEISFGSFAYTVGDTVVGDKIPAYGWKCEITVIDRTIPAVVGRKSFQTARKEREIVSEKTKEIRSAPPYSEIKKYLDSLPTK